MARAEREFIFDVLARQWLVGAAADVRLPFLDHAAVVRDGGDVSGEILGIWIARIAAVADLGGEREHGRIFPRIVCEGIKSEIAANETGGNPIWRGELAAIAAGRALLVGERLPQAVHGAFADL